MYFLYTDIKKRKKSFFLMLMSKVNNQGEKDKQKSWVDSFNVWAAFEKSNSYKTFPIQDQEKLVFVLTFQC